MIGKRKEEGSIQHSIPTLTEKAEHPTGSEPITAGLPGVSSASELQLLGTLVTF